MSFAFAVLVGFLTGLLTGAGVGGGTLLVLYLTAVTGVPQLAAQGVNLLYFLVTAPAALLSHLKNNLVEIKYGALAALCGSASALALSLGAQSFDPSLLKKAMAIFFIISGIRELFSKKQ